MDRRKPTARRYPGLSHTVLVHPTLTHPILSNCEVLTKTRFTDSFPRAIYPYRQFFGAKPTFFHPDPEYYIKKPLGYSWHHKELAPVPKAWVEKTGNLVWYRAHNEGGHFAAMVSTNCVC